jgi:LPS-assembly protein
MSARSTLCAISTERATAAFTRLASRSSGAAAWCAGSRHHDAAERAGILPPHVHRPIGQSGRRSAICAATPSFVAPNTTGFQNANIANFIETDDFFAGRATPAVGVEYRYPFVADAGASGSHGRADGQVIARPSEQKIGRLPNEDAQSLIFDDSSIFEWDKFSGYDRAEGGTRANLGARYSIANLAGFNANALVGQSVHIAARTPSRSATS